MFSILKPYIFSLDPEAAHDLAIKSLKTKSNLKLSLKPAAVANLKDITLKSLEAILLSFFSELTFDFA